MSDGLRVTLACGGAFLLALLTIELARRIAWKTEFLDRPRDYKKHSGATPYLGGAGVIAAFVVVATVAGDAFGQIATVMILAIGIWAMGTVDDRITLHPGLRFGIQVGAALVLWIDEVRWEPFGFMPIDLLITVIWVAGLTNAFNLLDNIDGASATAAACSAIGIGVVALDASAGEFAAVCFALAGACTAFLTFNFSKNRRIFLGDGGSMPIGFLVASLAMLAPYGVGGLGVLLAVPLAGIAIFDTSLVVLSRRRRGVGILTGGRDHSTHRLLVPFGTPLRVAGLLAAVQLVLCTVVLLSVGASDAVVWSVTAVYVAAGLFLLAYFEGPKLAPDYPEQTS